MPKRNSITFRCALFTLVASSLVLACIVGYSYLFSRKVIEKKIEENARNLTFSIVGKIDNVLLPVEKVAKVVALYVESADYGRDELLYFMRSVVEQNGDISGLTVAFAPHMFDRNKLYFAPCFYRRDGMITLKLIGGESYRYFFWDWYQIPKELNRPVWSEPYYEKGTERLMATYSVPFYLERDGRRVFGGVVAVDVSLNWLRRVVSSIKVGESGYAFLLSRTGRFITYPDERLVMNETIFTVAKELNRPQLRDIGRRMRRGEYGFVQVESILTGKKCWLAFAPLSSSGWVLGVMFPQGELMADITRLNTHMAFIGALGFLLLSFIAALIAGSITRPIVALTETTREVASGNLDAEIPYTHLRDEVGELARSFEAMKRSLKEYIEHLKETTAAKERIESELRIAANIQASMVPRTFPPFPERRELEIYAVMRPAREVGGDLYDFFFVDERRLCFIIGDVSGKGVPAALFMAILKYLLKTEAMRDADPSRILSRVNRTICPDNETCMFATLVVGVLDVETGKVVLSSAGHTPPLLARRGQGVSFMEPPKGFVVGVFEEAVYLNMEVQLAPDDILFLYTDGVTEARNVSGEFFSEGRVLERAAWHLEGSWGAEHLIKAVLEDVRSFCRGAPQSDDITMLGVRWNPYSL